MAEDRAEYVIQAHDQLHKGDVGQAHELLHKAMGVDNDTPLPAAPMSHMMDFDAAFRTACWYLCPECGGRLFAEIEAWETTSGKPEEAIVICEHEDWAGDDDHQHRWYDWEDVSARVRAWARANVRIL